MHTWGKSDGTGGIRVGFILRVSGYAIPVVLILLALRPPQQNALPRRASPESTQSLELKISELEQRASQTRRADEVHLTGDEISSALLESSGNGPDHRPVITLRDDLVTGQFVAKVAHQPIYVTVSGHLGAKDGYLSFEPTNFRLGDLTIPVALVHSTLKRKIEAQREQMKLPSFVGDVRVENGEVVVRAK